MENLLDEHTLSDSQSASYKAIRKSLRVTQAGMLVVLALLAGYFLWAMYYVYPEITRENSFFFRDIPSRVLWLIFFLLSSFGMILMFLLRGIYAIQVFCNNPDPNLMGKVLVWQNRLFLISMIVVVGFPFLVWMFRF